MISVFATAIQVVMSGADASFFQISAMLFPVTLLIARELAEAAANSSGSFKMITFAWAVTGVLNIPVVPLLFVPAGIVTVNLLKLLQLKD